MRHRIAVNPAWVALVLFFVVAGCDRQAESPEPIRIGVLTTLSASRQATVEAATLAVAPLDAEGGIEIAGQRRPIELLYENTHGSPDQAIRGVRRLIQQDVVAIIGPSRSREAIAAAGVAENARIPMISPASTHPETTAGKSYIFRVSFTDTFQGQALGRFARQDLGADTAAVLFDVASAYNHGLARVFRQAFEKAGGELVAFESYTTGETDFTRQLERIRDRRAEVLLLPNYYEVVSAQARVARELGIDAVLLGGDSWNLLPRAELASYEGACFVLLRHRDETQSHPRTQHLLSEYREAFGRDPNDHVLSTYDAFGLLFHAISQAGSDPDGIRQALAEIEDFPGVTGSITFRGTDGDPAKRLLIGRVERGETVLFRAVEPLAPVSPGAALPPDGAPGSPSIPPPP